MPFILQLWTFCNRFFWWWGWPFILKGAYTKSRLRRFCFSLCWIICEYLCSEGERCPSAASTPAEVPPRVCYVHTETPPRPRLSYRRNKSQSNRNHCELGFSVEKGLMAELTVVWPTVGNTLQSPENFLLPRLLPALTPLGLKWL